MMCTPENKLNRSCSESDLYKVNFDDLTLQDYSSIGKKAPIVRKTVLIVEEIIHDSSPGLLRSSSYGQSVPDHLHNLQNIFSTSLVLNNTFNEHHISRSMNTQLKPNFPKVDGSRNFMKNEDVIPMEVDFSNNSLKFDDCDEFVEMMDTNIDPDNFIGDRFNSFDGAGLKNRYTKKQPQNNICQESIASTVNKTKIFPISQKKQTQHNNFILILSVCAIFILFYTFFIQGYFDVIYVNSDIQLKNIHKDLLEKVHKQKASVNIVVGSLEQRDHWASKVKVLGFIGPTGVGKTFVANIIKKHFHQRLIHELYGVQLGYKSQWEHILTTLKSCCLNLIIIDDLTRKDLTDVFALVHSLPQDQYILVIPIVNVQHYDGKEYTISSNDIIEMRDKFDNSGLYNEVVVFQEFNIDEVKYWLREQLKLKNIEYNIQEKILKTVLEGHIVQYQGLKGLYSKVLLELEKYK